MKNLIRANREPAWILDRIKKHSKKDDDFYHSGELNGDQRLIREYQDWIDHHDKWSMTDWID